jgi:2-polyprenyl-3-methyl-5-hydroxy-6-metoxy-1,4-benzoquinol methylase
MKILVAIANFGTKNAMYLEKVLDEYRSMARFSVDIVVFSNIPKDVGPDVEVIVGLPTKDPWSLPFGHKALFADRMQQYDLFIYSEDDTLITERNIDAFVNMTRILPEEYVAGFIRYEISGTGTKYYNDFHNRFHWDPNSVIKIGEHIFAYYTNEHSACFILTQGQLQKAINSGGFLLPPRKGRYDMLVTSATDPYTQCGLKKLICISHLNDFCIHHLPNVYIDKMGVDVEWAEREIDRLRSIYGTNVVRGPLFDTNTLLEDADWEKRYHEPCRNDILSLIPKGIKRVLSVGCSCGSTESEMIKQGLDVVGIPLDCVIQVSAEARGVNVVPPDIEAAMHALQGRDFDCILFPDVLQHYTDPTSLLKEFMKLLGKDGFIVISVPNFNHASVVRRRMLGKLLFSKVNGKDSFGKYKIHFTTRQMIDSWLERCGLKVVRSYRQVEPHREQLNRFTMGLLKGILSRNVVVLCKRTTA